MLKVLVFAIAAAGLTAVGITAASSPARAAAAPNTTKVVVRPVHADGRPVAGYRVTRESIADFTCNDGSARAAVSRNIRYCGFSATNTVACWKSTDHTVLCLRDPRVNTLVRIRYTGSFQNVSRPEHASPQSVALVGGPYCRERDGGAWERVPTHPSWVGWYYCSHTSLYGPRSSDGIDRTVHPWLVHTVADTGRGGQKIKNYRVRTAYYVGTAP